MSSYKFNLCVAACLYLFLGGSSPAWSFTLKECLDADYASEVSHKGPPFGLSQEILRIQKNDCVLDVGHERYKFLKNRWVIDVCRTPVHIKEGVGTVDVLKREGACPANSKGKFCETLEFIESVMQDDGLIFANGEKEDIYSQHGQVYCAYRLIEAYLRDGQVMSRHNDESEMPVDSASSTTGAPPAAPAVPTPTPTP